MTLFWKMFIEVLYISAELSVKNMVQDDRSYMWVL